MLEIYPSCLDVQTQLRDLNTANQYRLTVIAGLYAPAVGQLVLVQTSKSAAEESPELGLKLPQGGIKPDEGIADAFFRETEEEVGIRPDQITAVVGLPLEPPMTGGRPRGGKNTKAYGVLCGIVDGNDSDMLPAFTLEDKIAHAGWFDLEVANEIFGVQARIKHTEARGKRSQRVLRAILGIDLTNLR